jgi:asparagine synthase (glutamine-hydrolysing)
METSGRISTFSIGFDDDGFDERGRARLVAQRYGTDHHELVLGPDVAAVLPKVATVFDEPLADSSALPTYLVAELARRQVKVALSGEGGDELFGGYFYYTGHLLARRLGWTAPILRPLATRMPPSTSKASTLENKVRRFAQGAAFGTLERHVRFREVCTPAMRHALLGVNGGETPDPVDLLRPRFAESEGAEEVARAMDVDLGVYLVEDMLVKTDRASMAHSLEARVPFLDEVVTDFALALPRRAKVRGFAKKRLIRRAMAPLLPSEIIDGPKRGFSIPLAAWLRSELGPVARDVLAPQNVARQGVFDASIVAGLLRDHVEGNSDNSRELWALLVFSLWHDRYANGVAA